MEKYAYKNMTWDNLRRLGVQCQAGQDVAFVVGMDGTRWAVSAFHATEAVWPGAPEGEYVLIVLGKGAEEGRAYPFRWQEGILDSGYVGSKLRIKRERDRNDLTRILAMFLGRTPGYPVGSEIACYTEEAPLAPEATIVLRECNAGS